MKNFVVANGEVLRDITVHVAFKKRRAPFTSFALLNLDTRLDLAGMSGQQAKLLLALLFRPTGGTLKELALAVGTSPASANRALGELVRAGKVERPKHGYYRVSKSLLHFGRWTEKGCND